MTVQAKVATILKTKLLGSAELASHEKENIYKGQALQVKKVTPATNQHLLLELVNHRFTQAYVYAPHWQYEQEQIDLPVTYYYQTDNPGGYGHRECNATCNAMLLNSLLNGWLDAEAATKGLSQPESIYLTELDKHGDTTDHNAQTQALRRFGIESYWSTELVLEDFYRSIRHGIPMVMGLDYKGPNHGHIVLGKGFNLQKRIIKVHDPYGARLGSSNQWISNLPEAGKDDEYGVGTMERLWFPNESLGWGRIVTHVRGVETIFAK